ncbi:MAG: amidase family protein, partial [Microcella sp.]|nr:amidase family protein [Microcella sp.]
MSAGTSNHDAGANSAGATSSGTNAAGPRGATGDLTRLSAAQLSEHLIAGDVSSVEVTQAHLDRIAAVDGDVHAFLHVNAAALDTAAQVDADRAAGMTLPALAGVPIAIKDVLVTTDMPSTSG